MALSELIQRLSESTPEGVSEHDRRQLDVFETDRAEPDRPPPGKP